MACSGYAEGFLSLNFFKIDFSKALVLWGVEVYTNLTGSWPSG